LLVISSLFLICLVLIQRGKGGGLAGAFGGVGGSSAFGTKAGDVFTRVTIITAGIWFLLAMSQVVINNRHLGSRTSAFALDDEKDGSRTVELPGETKKPSGTAAPKPATDGKTAPPVKGKAKTDSSLPSALEEEPASATEKPATPAKKTP
jgi:preprotein translocase subunit SecG